MHKTKEKKTYERVFIFLALILSIVNIGYTFLKDRSANEERISVFFSEYGTDEKAVFENVNIEELDIHGFVAMNYGIIISNNSKKKVSIVDTDVKLYHEDGKIMISGMYEGIYTTDFNKASMPIILDSGESKKYIIRIKLGLKKIVTESIKQEYQLPAKIDFQIVKNLLLKNKVDIYGNKTEVSSISPNLIVTPKFVFPEYILTLKTSNKTEYNTVISVRQYAQ